ncbi:hypothetical protein [Streptomyces sp. NPDC050485]|uniref:hypothetical protein n=1 Tax=Streptomyces sp. NPDC050485 TaxID=3365617 RepID=UPI0037B7F804
MITGHFSALDVLVLAPPVLAAVHLLLPRLFKVRPDLLGRRAAVFAGLWVLMWAVALALPRLGEAVDGELGGGQSAVVGSPVFAGVMSAAVAVALAGTAVSVVRACRRHVRLRPVAETELPVFREILADADRSGGPEAEWAESCLHEAETALGSGHGSAAVWQLHSAAAVLAEAEDQGGAGRRAAEVRDRLQAAGEKERVFDAHSPGYHSAV